MRTIQPDLAFLKNRLTEAGLKVTQQRLVILKAMYQTEEHPSAETVYGMLAEDNPALSLGTVYKTLDALAEKGLVRKVFCADGIKRYDIHTEPHAHLYCKESDKIMDFEDQHLESLIRQYLAEKKFQNFAIEDIQLQISGRILDPEKSVQYVNS
jgi:Fur family peroxide stress response transcriptional regulator